MSKANAFLFFACLVVSASALTYPDTKLPHGNSTNLCTIVTEKHTHVFATGADTTKLWHKWQVTADGLRSNWTEWTLRATAPFINGTIPGHWWGDPTGAVAPDGRIHLFLRYAENLDLWQMVQEEAGNAEQWSQFKEGHCTVACTEQTGCIPGGCTPECLGCLVPVTDNYFSTQLFFPTSNSWIQHNLTDGRIQVYYRGFDGAMYMTTQVSPTETHYTETTRLCEFDDESCLAV